MRRVLPAIGLFFLGPLVAEFLLGNISIDSVYLVLALAPIYGGGALLVREVARRTGRGWWTIVLLALAYGVVEEGFATQSLFNPNYVGLHLLGPAYIPALGIGAWWTLFVLTLHTVGSIAVPIAVVETFTRSRRTTPWLGRIGLPVTAVIFVLGVVATALGSVQNDPFVASPGQFAGAGVAVVVLVALAFLVGNRMEVRPVDGRAVPSPWLVGGASLLAGSAFMAATTWGDSCRGCWSPAIWCCTRSRCPSSGTGRRARSGGEGHRLALAGGALLTYAWHAFPQPPPSPPPRRPT